MNKFFTDKKPTQDSEAQTTAIECPYSGNERIISDSTGCKSKESFISAQAKPLSYIQDPALLQKGGECPVKSHPEILQNPTDLIVDPDLSLPTVRQVSSIPRATHNEESSEEYWIYPSQHQFYNSMKKKNFDPKEDDMALVVSIHNVVNERAWRQILEWEKKYNKICGNPKLKRFEGKPNDYSPKALWGNFWGYALPFDRHDWIVDRCGTEVRYVLDFYSGKSEKNSIMAMHIDVRPALDSVGAVYDRLQKCFINLIYD